MASRALAAIEWLLGPEPADPGRLLPRWIFLRGLGLIYFSAFYSFARQVQGLIGPDGILPVSTYLEAVAKNLGAARYWYAPTLLWFSSGSRALTALWVAGMVASILLVLNFWPRGMLLVCLVAFLSIIAAAQEFSSYQSDGMLLEAGFISFFFAPPGLRPGLGAARRPARAWRFLLLWEWFRIYFESGAAKVLGGDPEWRHLTAMDQYYQNGPLPTWIGWYVQHFPAWFHKATAGTTLLLELVVVWLMFFPRRWRIVCFCIVTPFEVGIILTANYCFLNYLVLLIGVLLLDDQLFVHLLNGKPLARFVPAPWRDRAQRALAGQGTAAQPAQAGSAVGKAALWLHRAVEGFFFAWIFYATTTLLLWMFSPTLPLPIGPVRALESFRIANQYGLFGRMTLERFELEFQASNDGENWTPYPFRYKPQDLREPPRIYAPYQPRFDWNLWFASLETWRNNFWVLRAQAKLLEGSPAVLSLFAGNPFAGAPPKFVRVVVWQYWFTDWPTKRAQGAWWRRQMLGAYSPTLEREPDGTIFMIQLPSAPIQPAPE